MGQTRKRLAVLGSTGSIGQQTLDIVRNLPDEALAGSSYDNISDLNCADVLSPSKESVSTVPPDEEEGKQLASPALRERRSVRKTADDNDSFDLTGWGAGYDTDREITNEE